MSSVCYIQHLFFLMFVMSGVCYVQGLLCLAFLCLAFVMSSICYVQHLLCLAFVMSSVCYAQHLLCLVIAISSVCLSRVANGTYWAELVFGWVTISPFLGNFSKPFLGCSFFCVSIMKIGCLYACSKSSLNMLATVNIMHIIIQH